MPQENLSLESLPSVLDGAIGRVFDRKIKGILGDLEDRPDLNKPREITLTIKMVPRAQYNDNTRQHDLDGIALTFSVKSKVPDAAAQMNQIAKVKGGEIVFATETPEDPDQLDLEDEKIAARERARANVVGPRAAAM